MPIDPRIMDLMAGRNLYQPPAIQGLMQMSQPPPQPPPQGPPGPNIWDRAFGIPGAEGILNAQALKAARRQGLLSAGISMLANAGGSFGQSLQAGLQAGQQGYQQQMGGALQAEREATRQRIQQKYAGRSDMQSRIEMFNDLVNAGLTEEAKNVAIVLQSELAYAGRGGKTLNPVNWILNKEGAVNPKTGKEEQYAFNPETQEVKWLGIAPSARLTQSSMSPYQTNSFVRGVRNDFLGGQKSTADQVYAGARFFGSATQIADAMARGKPDEAAWAIHALTMAFGKISDPGSVVREFEAAGIKNAGSLLQNAELFLARVKDGTITQEMLNSVARNVAGQLSGQKRVYDEELTAAGGFLADAGIDPSRLRAPRIWDAFKGEFDEYDTKLGTRSIVDRIMSGESLTDIVAQRTPRKPIRPLSEVLP